MTRVSYLGIHPSRRQFLLGGALGATSVIAAAATPRPTPPRIGPGGLEKAIPAQLGGWRHTSSSGLVVPPRDETEVRTYDQVLTRVYANKDGRLVMLLIAYGSGQTGMFEIHRPESCYPAQGYALSGHRTISLPLGDGKDVPAVFWTAKSDVRTEQLLYWTRIGNYFPRSWLESNIAVVRSNLVRKLPDGVLVRLSSLSNEVPSALADLQEFSLAMIQGLTPRTRGLLVGAL